MAIPTGLPKRYEIRVLEEKHIQWAAALVIHSNMFHSPIWPLVFPENKTRRLNDGMRTVDYLIRHQVESGYSLGVFDTEYVYKWPESMATEGKLYWNVDDDSKDAEQLLAEMDFPLVSVALAYDSIDPMDVDKIMPLIAILPPFGMLYHELEIKDQRDPATWKAKGPGEVLFRNATSTRHDYEGEGLMGALARYEMHWIADKGFRAIQIESVNDAVDHVWMNPPPPFRSEPVSEFHTTTFTQTNEEGQVYNPFEPSSQRITKVYCYLM